MVGADRRTTRGEITKLMLYAQGQSQITAEDVEAIVADAAPSNLDDVIDHALLGDLPAVETAVARFFHDGGDADYLMIRLVARLTLLHRLRLEMDQGRPFDAACQALFVKLPISARRALAKQAERWTTGSIAERLPAVRQASARVRTETRLAEVLATRALWALASRAARRETLNVALWREDYLDSLILCSLDSSRSVWIFLARRLFAAKTPFIGYWISLDFLGFSRPKSRLINGLHGINGEKFF